MNKDETPALYAQGKGAWNTWAKGMLDRRAEMEKDGTWAMSRDDVFDYLKPDNEVTGTWLNSAQADFTEIVFNDNADFRGFRFPGYVIFSEASFTREVGFNSAESGETHGSTKRSSVNKRCSPARSSLER